MIFCVFSFISFCVSAFYRVKCSFRIKKRAKIGRFSRPWARFQEGVGRVARPWIIWYIFLSQKFF